MPSLGLGRTKFSTLNHETSLVSALAVLALHAIVMVWFVRRVSTAYARSGDDGALFSKHPAKKPQYYFSALLLVLAVELPVLLSTPKEGLADLILGTDTKLAEILERVPAIRLGPSPPLLVRNRHMQFIPWLIQNEIHRRWQGIPFQRIDVEVSDCEEKMEDCHVWDVMNDTIALDVFPPLHDSPYSQHFNKSSPVILYAPGLRSSSQDMPGNAIVRKAHAAGFRSIVVNRRGLVHPLKSPRVNIFGDVEDMEQVYQYIKRELVTPDTPFFLHGISAGTAVTVTALSKWDKRRIDQPDGTPVFVASVDVVPGYDISRVMNRERFKWPYNDLLMQGVLDHFVLRNEEVLRKHDSDAVDKMLGAGSLQEVVDAGVAFTGYANTTAYYGDINPIHNLRDITTPKLVLNAADDPCCSVANLYEQSPYTQHEGKTFAEMIRETERTIVAVTYTGSHAPFICARGRWAPFVKDPLAGGWMLNSWADQVAIEYYRAALDVYGERRFL